MRYYLRLLTLSFFGLTVAFLLGTLSLAPSYIASREQASAHEQYRNALEGALGLKESNDTEMQTRILRERVTIAGEYKDGAFSRELFEQLVLTPRAGIQITTLAFSRTQDGAAMTIVGTADSRTKLLAFADALRNSRAFTAVTLPVSQLVTEEDISFSIQAEFIAP